MIGPAILGILFVTVLMFWDSWNYRKKAVQYRELPGAEESYLGTANMFRAMGFTALGIDVVLVVCWYNGWLI